MTADPEEAGADEPPAAPPPFLSRLLGAARLAVVLLVLPALAGVVLGGVAGAYAAVIGAFIAFVMALGAGPRVARRVMPAGVVVAGVSTLLAGTPAWVLLLTALGLIAGFMWRYGRTTAFALLGVVSAAMQPLGGSGSAAVGMLLAGLGALHALLLVARLPMPAVEPVPAEDPRTPWLAGALLGGAAGVSGAIAVAWGGPHAFWLPMTVFLIAKPTAGLLLHRRTAERLAGTVLGVAVGFATAPLPVPAAVRIGAGVVCVVLSIVWLQPLWANVALMTLATVLVLDSQGADPAVGLDRLGAVLIAAGLMVAIMVVAQFTLRRWPFGPGVRAAVAGLDAA